MEDAEREDRAVAEMEVAESGLTAAEQQRLIEEDGGAGHGRGPVRNRALSDSVLQGRKFCAPLLVVLLAFFGIGFYFVMRPKGHDIDAEGIPKARGLEHVAAPTILISIDGFRHEYLSRKKTASDGSEVYLAPTLNEIAKEGASATKGMQPVVPTKTFPNHWSLVTGLYPENTGIIGNTMYDPVKKAWFHLNRAHPDWWSGEPIWQTLRQTPRAVRDSNGTLAELGKNYTTACVFWPGSTVPKHAANAFWKYDTKISYARRIKRGLDLLEGRAHDIEGAADFVTLYFESVDHAGHIHGTHSKEVENEIQRVDETIKLFLEKLGENRTSTHNIIIVSDHGMTDISPRRVVPLKPFVPAGMMQDVVTSPMGLFLNSSVRAEELYGRIKHAFASHRGKAHVYMKEHLPERWHMRDSRLVPEVVTMASLGWTVTYPHQHLVPDTDSPLERISVRSSMNKGNHGFDNTYYDMQAIFLAQGPGFKAGASVNDMRSIDLYEMLCYMFGAQPAPNNGTLDTTLSTVLQSKLGASSGNSRAVS